MTLGNLARPTGLEDARQRRHASFIIQALRNFPALRVVEAGGPLLRFAALPSALAPAKAGLSGARSGGRIRTWPRRAGEIDGAHSKTMGFHRETPTLLRCDFRAKSLACTDRLTDNFH